MDTAIKIKIGNQYYKPRDEFNLISEKVLQLCNFHHLKNPNNSTTLKSGEGKAAFTNGLTVKEFRQKYNLR